MSYLENSTEFNYTKVPVKDNEKDDPQTEIPPYGYGVRHVQLLILFLCMSTSFIARGHLGVTLVAMISQPTVENNPQGTTISIHNNNTDYNETEKLDNNFDDNITIHFNITQDEWTVYRVYDWPKPIQEMVLTAFFLGYCLMMFPIAFVCQRWGGKLPLEISLYVDGIVSILTPWFALWGGWKAVCACRVLQGLSQAGTFPGTQTLLAQWVADRELATLSSYVYTGSTLGNVLGFQIGGLISAYWGWPMTYWVIGVLCLLNGVLLTVYGASSPAIHATISDEEKRFILGTRKKSVESRSTPLKAILTSKPMWGSFVTHIGSGIVFVFFLNQVSSYFHYILGIDIKSSGLLSSLPYVAGFFASLLFGVISDYFTNRNIISIKNARRVSNTFSQVGIAAALICTSHATSTTVVVICLVVGMCCQMAVHTGWMVNHIDLAPNYSGTLMSIGNTLMNLFIMLLPVMVSYIVIDVTNIYQWCIMMYLIAGIAFFTNLVFVFLMSADVQPWNEGHVNEAKIKDLTLESLDQEKRKARVF